MSTELETYQPISHVSGAVAPELHGKSRKLLKGVTLLEPHAYEGLMDRKMMEKFKSRTLKWALFYLLVGRIAVNVMTTCEGYFHRDKAKKIGKRLNAAFCHTLTGADFKACTKDVGMVMSKYDVDVGLSFFTRYNVIAGGEIMILSIAGLMFTAFVFIALVLYTVKRQDLVWAQHWLNARKQCQRLAGFSALKSLIFLNPAILTLYFNYEWFHALHGLYNLRGDKKIVMDRAIRGLQTAISLACVFCGILVACEAFKIKIMQYQHLLYKEAPTWTYWDWWSFFGFVNNIMSIYDVNDIKMARFFLVPFGGKDAKVDTVEFENMTEYRKIVISKFFEHFSFPVAVMLVFMHDSDDIQKIMIVDENELAEEDVQDKLITEAKANPLPAIAFLVLICLLAYCNYQSTDEND